VTLVAIVVVVVNFLLSRGQIGAGSVSNLLLITRKASTIPVLLIVDV
jgi:hypothetical protein